MAQVCITPLPGSRVQLDAGAVSKEVDLPTLCTQDDYRLLRWYFEDYAEDDPFQTSKAQEARDLVSTYGHRLAQSLSLPELGIGHEPVQVNIIHGHGDGVFWEALEDPTVWPSSRPPSSITVTRCFRWDSHATPDPMGDIKEQKTETTNILVVIARPQMDRDIPHRFVSSTIVKVAGLIEGNARVEIVRPGTFAAFEAHISSKPRGFFDIVHFDMHGEATLTSSTLLFLQKTHVRGKLTFTGDPRSAREVADVLVKNGVKYAVLNACRSAAATGSADSNIATTLLKRGLVTVVAMSYKIASSAVDQMVRAFYKGLLLQGLTLSAALRDARAAMLEHPAKQTRYGVAVDVLDYLVPRCFHRLGVESRGLVVKEAQAPAMEPSVAGLQSQDVVGRETDILLLESALLMESNVGILWGEPGIGKTALMRTIGEWWYKTFLISDQGFWHLDLGQEDKDSDDEEEESLGVETLDMAWIKAVLAESILGSADRASEIVPYLNKNRHLLIVDHLEAWRCPKSKSKRQQQKLLKGFLSEVFGGASLFVLVSRHPESWLDNLAPLTQAEKSTFSLRMTGLATSRGMSLFSDQVAQHTGQGSLSLEHDTSKYLEGLVKLVHGNPLALKMLAYDFSQKQTLTIKEYLPSLLEGATIDLEPNLTERSVESRVIRQLRRYSDKCTEELFEAVMDVRMAQIFLRHSGSADSDQPNLALSHIDVPLHPASLGMFWGVVPMETIVHFYIFTILGVMSNPTLIQRLRSFLGANRDSTPPGARSSQQEVINIIIFNLLTEPDGLNRISSILTDGGPPIPERLTAQVNTLITALHSLDLIDSPAATRTPQHDPQKSYHRLSPILTLYLRADSNFIGGRPALLDAFANFQLHSCLTFPFASFYWRDEWDEARRQIGLNFHNLYGALLAALHRRPAGNVLGEWSVLMIMSHLSKGVFADRTRYELLAVAFEETLERGLGLLAQPAGADPVVASVMCAGGGVEGVSGVGSPQEVLDLGLSCAVLLETILAATVFRTGQFDGARRGGDELGPALKTHYDAIMARLGAIDHDIARRAAISIEYAWKGMTVDVNSPEPYWEMRDKYLSWVAESNGDSTSASQDPFRGRNIPHWLNSLTISGSTLLDVQGEVTGLRKRKRFDEARQVVRRALEQELMAGSNQAVIRIGLLKCLVDIDTDDEKWDDAIANSNTIHELQDALARQRALTMEQRIQREQKLALLYDRAGDAATAQHFVRSLLRRANALHATDPPLEARTLLLLSKLPIVRRLDADVSAIYLLARALLVLERYESERRDNSNEVPRTTYGRRPFKIQVLLAAMKLTNDTQPQWMLGPANSRPQSVAIFFLATIFGQIVFPTFGARLLLDGSPSVQSMARSLGMSNPRSLLEYAALNMLVMLGSMLSSDVDSAVWGFLRGDGEADGPVHEGILEVAEDLMERLFQRPGREPRLSRFEGVDFEGQRVFFDHFYSVGEAWLASSVPTREADGTLALPETPWTPATIWGTAGPQGVFPGIMAVPEGYTVSTAMILRLAGYVVNEGE